ncbi:MAG TPA: glycosyltransferase family 1 protein, partial [Gaiellaceae bacterium]
MIVVDADFLGRHRTGDETYVRELLRALPRDLDLAAVTRRPDLVPEGIRAIELDVRVQELRMLWAMPRLLRRLRPSLAHFVHAIPPALPCPAVLTVQDLSFERDRSVMGARERAIFKTVVPWSARRAAHVFAISERTRDDLVELYGVPEEKITVTPLAPGPEFRPGDGGHDGYLLFVSSIEPRKDPLAALSAARSVGMPLVVVGPQRDPALVDALRTGGADVRGYVSTDELVRLYQRAACLVHPSLYEGFALTPAEAMACGTPVV